MRNKAILIAAAVTASIAGAPGPASADVTCTAGDGTLSEGGDCNVTQVDGGGGGDRKSNV